MASRSESHVTLWMMIPKSQPLPTLLALNLINVELDQFLFVTLLYMKKASFHFVG